MFFLIALFIFVPIAELYVIFKIGDSIGWLPTLALLVIDSIAGWWLLKSQGRTVWQRFQSTMQAGRVPHREVMDGVLVIFGDDDGEPFRLVTHGLRCLPRHSLATRYFRIPLPENNPIIA